MNPTPCTIFPAVNLIGTILCSSALCPSAPDTVESGIINTLTEDVDKIFVCPVTITDVMFVPGVDPKSTIDDPVFMTVPIGPVAPVTPCGPVGPTAPVGPIGPVGPTVNAFAEL